MRSPFGGGSGSSSNDTAEDAQDEFASGGDFFDEPFDPGPTDSAEEAQDEFAGGGGVGLTMMMTTTPCASRQTRPRTHKMRLRVATVRPRPCASRTTHRQTPPRMRRIRSQVATLKPRQSAGRPNNRQTIQLIALRALLTLLPSSVRM